MRRSKAVGLCFFVVQISHSTLTLAHSLVPYANLCAHKRRLVVNLAPIPPLVFVLAFKLCELVLELAFGLCAAVSNIILGETRRGQCLSSHTSIMAFPSPSSFTALKGDEDDAGDDKKGENNRRRDDQRCLVERAAWVLNSPAARKDRNNGIRSHGDG